MRIKLLQSHIWYGFYLDWVYYFRLMNLGLLKHSKSDQSADSFVPLLIYVILRANPEHLVSNVQYILRFRNQEKLGGEAGYYLSSLVCEMSVHQELKLLLTLRLDGSCSIHREPRSNKLDCTGRGV